MAKVSPVIPFSNTLGDFSVYKMKDVEKLVIRAKHGPTKEELATLPQYEKFRLYQSEFRGAGKAASFISQAIFAIKHLADTGYVGKLTKICKIIQSEDPDHHLGERSILFSSYGSILTGFNLRKKNPFDTVVNHQPSFSISRSALSATIELPKLHPGINLQNPWQLPLFRFILCLGIIPDMNLKAAKYCPVKPTMKLNPVKVVTPWYSTKSVFEAMTQVITLKDGIVLDASGTLVLSAGIEFGYGLTDSVGEAVKDAGCGKVLGVG